MTTLQTYIEKALQEFNEKFYVYKPGALVTNTMLNQVKYFGADEIRVFLTSKLTELAKEMGRELVSRLDEQGYDIEETNYSRVISDLEIFIEEYLEEKI